MKSAQLDSRRNKTSVLIQGESETGKKLLARGLDKSGRSARNLRDFPLLEPDRTGRRIVALRAPEGRLSDARAESLYYFRSINGGTLVYGRNR